LLLVSSDGARASATSEINIGQPARQPQLPLWRYAIHVMTTPVLDS
jgi:hypothetical protein